MPIAILFLSFIAIAATKLDAHTPKEGKILATSVLSAYRTRTADPIPSKDSPWRMGGGFVVEGDVDQNGGIEIALLYLDKYYLRNADDNLAVEKIDRAYITTGYRHWFIKQLSAGAAFFSAYTMGDPHIISRQRDSEEKYLTTVEEIVEYGLDFSLQWEVWSHEEWALVADARYALSLTHKPQEYADVYTILLGVKYEFPKFGPQN